MASETKHREPGCECHLEEGDSPCIVHGLYEADTVAADTKRGVDWWFCPICGPQVESDEDGLCVTCGATVCAFSTLCSTLASQDLHVVTAADKAVLDACAAAELGEDDPDADPTEPQEVGEECYIYTDDQCAIARAELARREAAK